MTHNDTLALAAIVGAVVGWLSAGLGDKSQIVRAFDVLVLGPWLIASSAVDSAPAIRLGLAFSGGATIGYNARNYLDVERGR